MEGINKTGRAIPETTPKSFNASVSLAPAFNSMMGSKTATRELTKEALARTAVIGKVDLHNGRSVFLGFASFPPFIKKQMQAAEKEKR